MFYIIFILHIIVMTLLFLKSIEYGPMQNVTKSLVA